MNYFSASYYSEQDTTLKQGRDTIRNVQSDSLKHTVVQGKAKPAISSKAYIQISTPSFDSSIFLSNKKQNTLFADYVTHNSEEKVDVFFIDKSVTTQSQNINNTIIISKSQTNINNIKNQKSTGDSSVLFVFLVSCLVLLAIVVRFYSKYVNQVFEATIYKFSANRLITGKTLQIKRLFSILDVLFFLSAGLLLFLFLERVAQLVIYQNAIKSILGIVALLVLLRIVRVIAHRTILLSTGYKDFITSLNLNTKLFSRASSIILTPLVFLAYYFPSNLGLVVIYAASIVISIALIMRALRTFKLFIDNGFSIFYFILYLCALEIIPILIIYKLVYFF